MKKLSTILLALATLFSTHLFAQFVPEGFSYQTVLRNSAGNALANQPVSILFSIKSGAPNGPVAYAEKHVATTNELGLVNLVIGQGAPQSGDFSAIGWGGGSKYLTVAIESGGGVFDELGTTQLMSVPYAQYALNVANGGGGGAGDDWGAQTVQADNSLKGNGTGGNPLGIAQQNAASGQVLKWDGTKWAPSDDVANFGTNGGTVTQINTGAGLTGGPITVAGTIGLQNSGVAPGTWGSATQIPVFTVDATGRVTNVFTVTPQPGTIGIAGGSGIATQQNGFNFTITNTGDTNPFDDLTNNSTAAGDVNGPFSNLQIAQNAVTTFEIADQSILGNDINKMDALNGQVLKWNGSNWVPSNDLTGINTFSLAAGTGIAVAGNAPNFTISNTGDTDAGDDLTKDDVADGDVSGTFFNLQIKNSAVGTPELNNGAVTAAKIASMNATNGQVLKFNGTAWQPAADNSGGNLTAGNGISISGNPPNLTITNDGDTDESDDLVKTDVADGDVSGIFTNLQIKNGAVGTPEIAPASVTGTKLNQMGAQNGQFLRWNGTIWGAADVPAGSGDNWGTQTVAVGATLSGNGTAANPLNLAQQGATTGQVLRWNGTNWLPGTVTGGGGADNWGSQVVATNQTLSGDGTAGNPLKIATQSASAGQVLKFNGTNWVPAADLTGSGGSNNNYAAGAGISITGTAPNFTITNTGDGDASPTNELQNLSLAGTTLSISGGNSVSLAGIGGGGAGNFWVGSGNNISSTNTGNVGIGTATPNWKFTLAGNGEVMRLPGTNTMLGFGNDASNGPRCFLNDLPIGFFVATSSDTLPVVLAPGKKRTMVVGGRDNVSIGTGVQTNFALEVSHGSEGFNINNQTGNGGWEFWVSPVANTLNLYNSFGQPGVPVGVFGLNGNYTPSDERLKKDVTAMPSILDKLMKIKPVTYHFNFEKDNDPISVGFLAQNLQSQFPELVRPVENKEGQPSYLTVNYAGLGVLAVKAVQEQQSEIEILKKENAELKLRLEKIEKQLEKN